jgi:hypothetical protein
MRPRFDHDASCLNSENCWGIRLTAKVSATISARFQLSNEVLEIFGVSSRGHFVFAFAKQGFDELLGMKLS